MYEFSISRESFDEMQLPESGIEPVQTGGNEHR